MMTRTFPMRFTQVGTSLIEVLVSVVILSVGLLGVAGMQMSSLRSNQAAYERSISTILMSSIRERMAANRDAALGGAYDFAGGGACAAPGVNSLATRDLSEWITELQSDGMLGPTGCGSIACDAAGLCVVTLKWTDSRSGLTEETPEVTTEVRL